MKKADLNGAKVQIDKSAMGLIKALSKKFDEAEKEVDLAKMERHITSYTNEL